MKIKPLQDGRWEFDSGEVRGTRTRLKFDSQAVAEAWLRKAKTTAKDEGEKMLVEWLSISGNELAEIIKYRRAVLDLNGKPDWKKGHELHVTHLTAAKTGGSLDQLLKEYIARKRSRSGSLPARAARCRLPASVHCPRWPAVPAPSRP